mmetsp:Transcript_39818/g.55297  ORF Transcript_39818/g.55297 Transcript_39818/m.55297 type:complete len:385 (+) Transcript_39818:129-1283(+)|eukprot:CAMPEP_0196578908 /NCGR_PEP_ID=MMETSP1081-20130531/12501_1 /TAXON_ID=36882 /ORGANISM="Pyramimonas amylifera, Strain CCMP720" /LENGTH=384 /DNA_ID=CAMNT_0041898297 /DNA_START=127 /DNA_END=1281 /DNA_ORIENTATION=+
MTSTIRVLASCATEAVASSSANNRTRVSCPVQLSASKKLSNGVSKNALRMAKRTPATVTRTFAAVAEAEANEMPTYADLDRLLEKYDFKFNVGDLVVGTVFSLEQRGAFVDIGSKAAAYVPMAELSLCTVDKVSDVLEVGSSREFMIINDTDAEGQLALSLRRIQIDLAWARVNQLMQEDVTIYGEVVTTNRGGVLCQVEGLRGFVPSSHITISTPREELIGVEIPLKLIEVDEERSRLVLSNKRAMAEENMQNFQVGDVVVGTVQSIQVYGAFVDIGGGMNGLLHISQISHERITAVENVLTVGDQLKVMILSQDKERGRLSLSTRKLEPTPGDMLRDPQLVFDKADEMASTFRERVAAAEAAARAEEGALFPSDDTPASSEA